MTLPLVSTLSDEQVETVSIPEDPDSVEPCPKCGSPDTWRGHRAGDFVLPECDYKVCQACGHQWDHK